MIGIPSSFLAMGMSFLEDQMEIKKKNKEKLDQLKVDYREAVNLPRKKKKAARKRISKDYGFWHSIGKWHDEILPLDF